MSNARWIWLKGDFELYHSLLLHGRRVELGVDYPVMWDLALPYPNVTFRKDFVATKNDRVTIFARGKGYVLLDGKKYPVGEPFDLSEGAHSVAVNVMCTDGSFPAIYANADQLKTDESWTCTHKTAETFPVGSMKEYATPTDNPHVFPFRYSPMEPAAIQTVEGGVLYDFGKETFCRITITGADPGSNYSLYCGESREEALDATHCIIRQTLSGESEYHLTARAFRYLYLKGNVENAKIFAEYEYLPLQDRASFECNDPSVRDIWNMCAYTFHLNSREFFLDGIKRDRWVWSGDAYQSYMANNYLYFDNEITKRTILALLGKPPYEQHVNTINDYTMYLIIAVMEYYQNSGDEEFIRFVWKRVKLLYRFLAGRTDENDYVCRRSGDWIFIDWSDMDKSGNLCAEQILYWQTKNAMAFLSDLMGEDGAVYRNEAKSLRAKILRDFWRDEKGAFIDCYSSGRENVTRHANISALIYDFVEEDKAKIIFERVLENDEIQHITTPYFEFFELLAYGKRGKIEHIQEKIESYWGGILRLGGTSVWEQFDPTKQGAEHYEMYGKRYGCSLCHAWGSGPIYLLGRFCLGVYPTDTGYQTFCVEPNPGKYEFFQGTVPLPQGEVSVTYRDGRITVAAGAEGGTLRFNGKEYPLQKDVPLTV